VAVDRTSKFAHRLSCTRRRRGVWLATSSATSRPRCLTVMAAERSGCGLRKFRARGFGRCR
jgi:hypothetical protein